MPISTPHATGVADMTTRTVTLKIGPGGHMVACHPGTTSDLAIRVTDVPETTPAHVVHRKLTQISWMPMTGPWVVTWPRIANAAQGTLIRL